MTHDSLVSEGLTKVARPDISSRPTPFLIGTLVHMLSASEKHLGKQSVKFSRIALVCFAICGALSARAQESIGDFSISGIFLEPTFTYNEPNRGHFDIGRSFLAATWTRDQELSATVKVGTKNLVGLPIRYGPEPIDELGLIEACAQLDSPFGRIRAGLVPVPFGIEGGDAEERLRFPRSLVFQRRVINLRDHGVSYRIGYQGFFNDWAVHNGESGSDLDNEAWFTGRWGWQGGRFVRAGISGSAGATTRLSTNPTGTNTELLAGMNPDERARIRIANMFVEWEVSKFHVDFEATAGDTTQDSGVRKLRATHLDLEYLPNESVSWLGRYDRLDPSELPNDRVDEATLGIAYRSRYENSVLYFLATRQTLENVEEGIHRFQLVWRLTPSANSFRSAL